MTPPTDQMGPMQTSRSCRSYSDPVCPLSQAHPNEPVDVYFCRPPALGTALREQCWKYGFFYHEEKFQDAGGRESGRSNQPFPRPALLALAQCRE